MTTKKNTSKKKKIKVTGLNYNNIKYDEEVYYHENGLQKCSICGWKIPADMQRLSYDWSGYQRSGSYRVCAICLIEIMKNLKGRKKANDLLAARMEALAIEQL